MAVDRLPADCLLSSGQLEDFFSISKHALKSILFIFLYRFTNF
jgi:hypothetical protein